MPPTSPAALANEAPHPSTTLSGTPPPSSRNLTADGLRGVAAMLVVIYHLYLNTEAALRPHLPAWVDGLLKNFGGLGVCIFFVLSGFVISMSLRGARLSGAFAARFALRRSLRLDPPYWVTIAACMLLAQLSARIVGNADGRGEYSVAQVVAHLFYLQDILGYAQISAVFWTLCIELQFYLVLVLLLTLFLRKPLRTGAVWAVSLLCAASMALALTDTRLPVPGLFVPYWHMFALGIVTCWCLFKDVGWGWWRVMALGELLVSFGPQPHYAVLAALLASLVLIASARWQPARHWLGSRASQYLGRLSYSLYLTHPTIGWSTISVLKKLFGEQSFGLGLLYIAAGIATSIISAQVLYQWVELPAIRWSRKVRLPHAEPARG